MAHYLNYSETGTGNHGQASKHVLIVDDNYASRLVAKVLLERENYAVTLAEDGQQAISIASIHPLDLILMDIQMPVMDGLTAAQKIRALDNSNENVPIIALTAYADKTVLAEVQAAGMSELLTKPLKLGQLRSAWQRAETIGLRPEITTRPAIVPAEISENTLNPSVLDPLIAAAPPLVLHRLFERYFKSADSFITAINTHAHRAATGDAQALIIIRKQAHSLKGASANVGFLRLSNHAAKLQNISASDILTLTPELAPLLAQSRAKLDDYLRQPLSQAS